MIQAAACRSERIGTFAGLGAILLWSTLALLTTLTGDVPPFQLTFMALLLAGAVGAASWIFRPGAVLALKQPPKLWAIGIGSMFGYHAFYFAALRLAPPAEAAMVNYLWPLLLVLGASFTEREPLGARPVLGAVVAFGGIVLLAMARARGEWHAASWPGYLLALMAALTWAAYSLLSRRHGAVSTDIVAGFCLGTSLLALVAHLVSETTVWPRDGGQWAAIVALGAGPAGASYYLWDFGMKRGNLRAVGVLSYAAPLLTAALLVTCGRATLHWSLAAACALITAGAALARKPSSA